MIANIIVDNLLENGEFYGPPEPDMHQKALGSTRHVRGLHSQAGRVMGELEVALQIERQLKKAGVTRNEVSSYIRADQEDPGMYWFATRKTTYPANAYVGMHLNDGRKIMFDFPVLPAV